MEANKKVLALIVTWNGAAVIRKCLDSLRHSTVPLVTYIVDNNSEDNTTTIVLDEYPDAIQRLALSRNPSSTILEATGASLKGTTTLTCIV